MSYKTELQSNNADLQSILAKVNALPEAGSGEVVEPVIEELAITENGTYTAPDGVDGYSPVTVNVPVPDGYIKPSGTKIITENGTHDAKEYESVAVNVPTPEPVMQEKSVTPTKAAQNVTPDNGYDGLSSVVVNGDANLVADNIKSGVSIFGVAGSYEGNGGSGGIPEFSTVRVYMKDVHLSESYYCRWGHWNSVALYCYYIDEEYKDKSAILFDNNDTGTLDKSEVIFTVPTNSTIVLSFESMMNHYVDAIVSSVHNELHNIRSHGKTESNYYPIAEGGRFQVTNGGQFSTVPIWGDTEIRISELDN
jgi:hypothetical protein